MRNSGQSFEKNVRNSGQTGCTGRTTSDGLVAVSL